MAKKWTAQSALDQAHTILLAERAARAETELKRREEEAKQWAAEAKKRDQEFKRREEEAWKREADWRNREQTSTRSEMAAWELARQEGRLGCEWATKAAVAEAQAAELQRRAESAEAALKEAVTRARAREAEAEKADEALKEAEARAKAREEEAEKAEKVDKVDQFTHCVGSLATEEEAVEEDLWPAKKRRRGKRAGAKHK